MYGDCKIQESHKKQTNISKSSHYSSSVWAQADKGRHAVERPSPSLKEAVEGI